MHFDLLQKHENLAVKKASCKNWQNFDVVDFAESFVAPIDSDNPENVWNSVLMNEISYVDKKHPLITEYVRNQTCPFFADEVRTIKRPKRQFWKTYQIGSNSQAKRRFSNSDSVYFELFTKMKSEYRKKKCR